VIMMERRLEKGKNSKEMGRGHEGCKRKHCTLQMLLREKGRTEGLLKPDEGTKPGPNFDEILNDYEYRREEGRRLCRIERMISSIQEKGSCDGVKLEGLIPSYIIDEEIKKPKPESEHKKL